MSEIVVRVENLGKRFFLGHQKSGDLRQTFGQTIKQLMKKSASKKEEFWALKDLSFEIKRGEVVGVIGRNGAGKSTLLKVLSRITHPTTGRFEIEGRVSSLLEVGTGFHSELSGRENIFLNGTILGMRRAEIRGKFDEIVAFSGIENFIDTPVKHYSSGMKVRLAFSVAAHLEPEILIIDEVLAVGDAEFQKKCLGKMDEVSKKEGRTILFVSHNLAALEHLCSNGILLKDGRVKLNGSIREVVESYLQAEISNPIDGEGELFLADGVCVKTFLLSQTNVAALDDLEYTITIKSSKANRFTDVAILIYNHLNERVGILDLRHRELPDKSSVQNEFTIKGKIKGLPLMEGTYHCGLYVSSVLCQGDFLNLNRFEVSKAKYEFVPYASKHRGYLEFNNSFSIQ